MRTWETGDRRASGCTGAAARTDGYATFRFVDGRRSRRSSARDTARAPRRANRSVQRERGRYDLPLYIDHLEKRIGDGVILVIACDSGFAAKTTKMWSKTSCAGSSAATPHRRDDSEGCTR